MDLASFEYFWPEIILKQNVYSHDALRLQDILIRCKGEVTRDGYRALSFDHINEDLNPFILRSERKTFDSLACCYKWNEETEKWGLLGIMFLTNEWGNFQLRRLWEQCGIVFPNTNQITALKDIFSQCLGEKSEGLLFIGREKFRGDSLILKLDEKIRLPRYLDPQKCFFLNKETEEWEILGTLFKKLPAK